MKQLLHPRWWIFLAVMAAAFLGVDRLAANIAEKRVAMVIQEDRVVSGTPEVDIKGVPFLTQVIGGKLEQIDIQASGVSSKSQGIVAERVNSRITNIETSFSDALVLARDPYSATDDQWPVAEQVDVVASISYAALARQVNSRIGQPDLFEVRFFAGSAQDRLGFETRLKTALGDVPTRGEAKLSLSKDSLRIQIDPNSVSGLSGVVMKALRFGVDQEMPVAEEYPGVEPTGLRVEETRLSVTAQGQNIVLKTDN